VPAPSPDVWRVMLALELFLTNVEEAPGIAAPGSPPGAIQWTELVLWSVPAEAGSASDR